MSKARSSRENLKWALRLFDKSPLKQKKLKMISEQIDDLFADQGEGIQCLDIGSDNGVISHLLRKKGGVWFSADLTSETVSAIKSLGLERVYQIDGLKTDFNDNQFDLIVIVDFLEHIETDREFVAELVRILKPNGRLVVNVPRPVNGLLRKLQYAIGQTDEVHGHVRPGYSHQELSDLVKGKFKLRAYKYYNRCFTVFIDTMLRAAMELKKGHAKQDSSKSLEQKGVVFSADDVAKSAKLLKLYALVYPVIKVFVMLDSLVPFLPGNILVCSLDSDV